MMKKNQLFPVFLKIKVLRILYVGDGIVGAEKLRTLLKNFPEANITVFADKISTQLTHLAVNHSNVGLVARTRKQPIHVNVPDTPDQCDFYLGSVVQKGDLKIGISNNGKSPSTAKRMREFLESQIPEDLDPLLENLHQFRSRINGDFQRKVQILSESTKSFLEKDGRNNVIKG